MRSQTKMKSKNEKYDILRTMYFDRKRNIADNLFICLREIIQSGEIPSKYAFPNEKDFCELLSISRGTLREAYSKLSALNLISRNKSGTIVNDVKGKPNSLPFDLLIEQADLSDVLDLRAMLEEEIASRAAQRITQDEIDVLQTYIDKMKESIDNINALCIYDAKFHSTLARISGSKLWLNIFNEVREYFEASIYLAFSKDNTIMFRALLYHERILNALKQKDSIAAKTIMREHINNVRDIFNNK
jgi:GntR family transcriptional repressor for pyruvate dehydrogenase complex